MFDHIRCFRQPSTISEAITLLQGGEGQACLVAGGTDVALRAGRSVQVLVDTSHLGLSYIKRKGGGLHIGATTTMAYLEQSVLVRLTGNGILAQAAACCGSPQTRNMATIGGNLANASPAADTATPLLVMGANVVLQGLRSSRTVPLEDYFAGPHSTNSNRELLVEVVVPRSRPSTAFAFQRLSRTEIDIALVAAAVAIRWGTKQRCAGVRIALGAVAPCPMRARRAEAVLEGQLASDKLIRQAASTASQEIAPITDVRASSEYRREISQVLTRRALEDCIQRLVQDGSVDGGSRNGGAQ